jgi:hypothetical protein
MIFDFFAPRCTSDESIMSPEIPAICGSITKTMKMQGAKMHINSKIGNKGPDFLVGNSHNRFN